MSRENRPPDDESRWQIGEVAKRTGLTHRTLRYYEELGLLVPSGRLDGGFRLYTEADVQRLGEIQQLKDVLGASLREIKTMLEAGEELRILKADYHQAVEEGERRQKLTGVHGALRRQLEVVDSRAQQLLDMRADLLRRLARVEEMLGLSPEDSPPTKE